MQEERPCLCAVPSPSTYKHGYCYVCGGRIRSIPRRRRKSSSVVELLAVVAIIIAMLVISILAKH